MPILYHTSGAGDPSALKSALAALPDAAPVIVLIHGYKFAPGDPLRCPYTHILSLRPERRGPRALSWPRHLGAVRAGREAPLCIAFGWPAQGSIWRAWGQALRAAQDLVALVSSVHGQRGRPVQIFAHSLGARVALEAVRQAPAGSVGRVVLLSGAVLRSTARAALDSPAGRQMEVLNVTSRENDLFDLMLEASLFSRQPTVGAGLGHADPRWLDLQIDAEATRQGLRSLGHVIARPVRRVCHWSTYLRPGLFPLYRRFLGVGRSLDLHELRAAVPGTLAPRWSQLHPRHFAPRLRLGLLPRAGAGPEA